MNSYQAMELGQSAAAEQPSNRPSSAAGSSSFWRYAAVISCAAGAGLLLYSSSSASSPAHSSKASKASLAARPSRAALYASLQDDQQRALFDDFVKTHERKYVDKDEETKRFTNFKAFLSKVDERNSKEEQNGGTAVHGITKFADFSDEELKQRILNYKPLKDAKQYPRIFGDSDFRKEHVPTKTDKDASENTVVDWRTKLTTHVKDQGYCGSCWAMSAVEQIESDAIRAGYIESYFPLSVQQVVSCDHQMFGCNGGYVEAAYKYIKNGLGLAQADFYPYTSYYGTAGDCIRDFDNLQLNRVTVDTYHTITTGEADMASYVLSTGPLSVCLDASEWSSYQGGVVSTCGTSIDHCVQIVGVDLSDKASPYWLIRNSWGTSWGDQGYLKLGYGSNLCDIEYSPTYTTVSIELLHPAPPTIQETPLPALAKEAVPLTSKDAPKEVQ